MPKKSKRKKKPVIKNIEEFNRTIFSFNYKQNIFKTEMESIVILQRYLELKVFLQPWRSHSKSVVGTGLVAVQANITIHEQVADPQLFKSVRVFLRELVAFGDVAYTKKGACHSVIFLNCVPSPFHCTIASLLFIRQRSSRTK